MAGLNENIAGGSNTAVRLKSKAGGEKTDFTTDTTVETTTGSKGKTTTLTHALPSTSSTPLTKEQRLAEIKKNRGAITWNPGAIHDGRRWDVILYPYEQKSDHLVLVSKRPPAGATVVNDARSAFKTAKMLYGKAPNRDLLVSGMVFGQPAMLPETSGRIPLYYRPLSTDGKLTVGLKAALPSTERGWPPKLRAFPLRRVNKLI